MAERGARRAGPLAGAALVVSAFGAIGLASGAETGASPDAPASVAAIAAASTGGAPATPPANPPANPPAAEQRGASADTPPDARSDTLPPTVYADGTGLPPGGGTARAGAAPYAARCAGCHGAAGEGGRAVELVGERALLASDYPDRGIGVYWPYAPPLFDYVRRAMPPDAPYSLDADETYAVLARLLELNGLVGADTRVDAAFLAALEMPNAAGFERAPD